MKHTPHKRATRRSYQEPLSHSETQPIGLEFTSPKQMSDSLSSQEKKKGTEIDEGIFLLLMAF